MKQDNLMDLLHTEGIVNAGMSVRTSVLNDMEIYGFIPITSTGDFLSISFKCQTVDFLMQNTKIVSDRLSIVHETFERRGGTSTVKVTKHEVHPILRCVHLQENGGNNRIPLRGLYIPQYRDDRFYLEYRKSVNPTVGSVARLERIVVVDEEDRSQPRNPQTNELPTIQVCYYEPTDKELLFGRNIDSPVRAVGEEFVVVCRRLNPVTGNSVLEVFNPEELYPVYQKENNQ